MAYTPTTWETGDVVTAEKLNKLEQGLSGVETDVSVHVTDPESDGNIVITIGS